MSFIYLGHGSELSLTNNKKVPTDCTLSTITEAGLPGYLSATLQLCNIFRSHRQMLNNPIEHKAELKQHFLGKQSAYHRELLEGKFHLKREGLKYKNKFCDFLLAFDLPDDKIALFRSGLYDINTPGLELPMLEEGDIYDGSSITADKSGFISVEHIRILYKDSLYPSIDAILEYITADAIPYSTFVAAVQRAATMDIDQLMHEFPGNHYYFICRTPTRQLEPNNYRQLRLERANSHPGENEPVDFNNNTLSGKHNFEAKISELYFELYKERDTNMLHIKDDINRFLESEGREARHINTIILAINESLVNREFNEDDIDEEFLDLIKRCGVYGVKYIYTMNASYKHMVERIMNEVYRQRIRIKKYRDLKYALDNIKSVFKLFIESGKEEGYVNHMIQILNDTLPYYSMDESDIDPEFLALIKESQTHGAIPYLPESNSSE